MPGKNKSEEFTMAELEKVLKNLKNDKSKDFNGYINEPFKEGVAGKDLKQSLLMMFYQMKNKLVIPECLRILQKKKCRLDLNNWRGIFECSVLRTVLMKMIYERTYPKVEKNMTDSQIGATKNKSVRNHLSFHFEFHFK